jgi:proteasome assembly chaperone (PAC2) family protein
LPALEFTDRPDLTNSILLAAWGGWPDAGEAATRAVREVIRQLDARKFASIDHEDYYDFADLRPVVSNEADGSRKLSWPENDFYYIKASGPSQRDIVLFLGVEPHLKWRQYVEHVMTVAGSCDVQLVITVGALLDSVPHTREPRVTGSSPSDNLGPGFESIQFPKPVYEGPSGITSAVLEKFGDLQIRSASIWGHSPHYVQVAHNPMLTVAILKEIQVFLPKTIELGRLEKESEEFGENLVRALEDQKDIEGYVKRLEERYDSEEESRTSPEPEALVRELEEFLRKQRQETDDTEDGDKD